MSTISVQLHDAKRSRQPGEKLQGIASWMLDAKTSSIELRLFWVATGAAPQQVGVVEKRVLSRPAQNGTESFQFVLPNGPWSYCGRMVNVVWHIEAVVIPSLASGRATFVLSPTDRPMTAGNIFVDEDDDEEPEAAEAEPVPPVAGS